MLCASTPKDIVPQDGGWEPLEYIRQRLSQLFEELEDIYCDLGKAYAASLNCDELLRYETDFNLNYDTVYKGNSDQPIEYIYHDKHYTPEEWKKLMKNTAYLSLKTF